jgi:hypothetical protein
VNWETIADNLSRAGWSWGCVSAENLDLYLVRVRSYHVARSSEVPLILSNKPLPHEVINQRFKRQSNDRCQEDAPQPKIIQFESDTCAYDCADEHDESENETKPIIHNAAPHKDERGDKRGKYIDEFRVGDSMNISHP